MIKMIMIMMRTKVLAILIVLIMMIIKGITVMMTIKMMIMIICNYDSSYKCICSAITANTYFSSSRLFLLLLIFFASSYSSFPNCVFSALRLFRFRVRHFSHQIQYSIFVVNIMSINSHALTHLSRVKPGYITRSSYLFSLCIFAPSNGNIFLNCSRNNFFLLLLVLE